LGRTNLVALVASPQRTAPEDLAKASEDPKKRGIASRDPRKREVASARDLEKASEDPKKQDAASEDLTGSAEDRKTPEKKKKGLESEGDLE
jgi:hypothetical protein